MKYLFRRILITTFVLSLMILSMPSAFGAVKNSISIQKIYSDIYIGFVSIDTYVYETPSEFSRSISLPKGFPVYVVGETNDFFIVRNHNGTKGYILRHELTPLMPSGAEPFYKSYDPKWEVPRLGRNCLLMLPEGMRIHKRPDANSAYVDLPENTPCRIVGKSGNYYLITNMACSITAYFHPASLIDATTVGYSRTV